MNKYREMYKRMLSNVPDDVLWEVAIKSDDRVNRNMWKAAQDMLDVRGDSRQICPACGQHYAWHETIQSSAIEPMEYICPRGESGLDYEAQTNDDTRHNIFGEIIGMDDIQF